MASDELLQRSIKLLDEAVGSPTSYTSPRPSRHRSSMFSSSALPLRNSDVRQFALNTSLTMSTSELDLFMDHSHTSATAANRTSMATTTQVAQASDNLYQTFLESMQVHLSAREVIMMIKEFEQDCSNVMKVLRETQDNGKDMKWLEQERNTWRLLGCLYKTRLSLPEEEQERKGEGDVREKEERDRDTEMMVDVLRPPSEKEIMENLYSTNLKIVEYQMIADWLEKNAEDAANAAEGPRLRHYMDNTVAWENTLHQLQNKKVAYASSRPLVEQVDPDAPLRTGRPLHDLDMEDEARLLRQVWSELRCGHWREVQDACVHCGQPWRAGTLEGWKLFHDPNYSVPPGTTKKQPVEGNPHRDIWKLCAWRLADDPRAGVYSRAVYGLLCGHVRATLPACETWEDLLWVHTRTLCDILVEEEIRNNSLREYTPMPDAYWDNRMTMEEILTNLDSSADPTIRQQAMTRETTLQKLIILDRVPQLMTQVLAWVRRPDCSRQQLRFLAHLVLALRMLGLPTSQEDGDEVIKLYVKVLMSHGDPNLVAFYTSTLPPEAQVALYAEFLQHIEQSELRRAALTAAETVQLPVEAITQRVVENIRGEEKVGGHLTLGLSEEVTEEDKRKVYGLEWVVMYPSQRAEALWQTNALIRTFLAYGKIQAARLAFNQIPADSIDQVMSQWPAGADDDTTSVYSDCLPPRVAAAIQEYLSHKAYLDAQEGFADWFAHFTHARPKEPPTPPPGASFTDKVAHDHRTAAYQRDLARWQAALDHQTRCVKQQLYNVLLFPHGGWLADSYREDQLRSHQMKSLRTLCLPKIVLLVHTVLHSVSQYKEAIQLADLVVEEQHQLYQVYSNQQMGELLGKIRESSLASLAQGKDPWGHMVTS